MQCGLLYVGSYAHIHASFTVLWLGPLIKNISELFFRKWNLVTWLPFTSKCCKYCTFSLKDKTKPFGYQTQTRWKGSRLEYWFLLTLYRSLYAWEKRDSRGERLHKYTSMTFALKISAWSTSPSMHLYTQTESTPRLALYHAVSSRLHKYPVDSVSGLWDISYKQCLSVSRVCTIAHWVF